MDDVQRLASDLGRLDWRLHGLTVMPVPGISRQTPPVVADGDGPAAGRG